MGGKKTLDLLGGTCLNGRLILESIEGLRFDPILFSGQRGSEAIPRTESGIHDAFLSEQPSCFDHSWGGDGASG